MQFNHDSIIKWLFFCCHLSHNRTIFHTLLNFILLLPIFIHVLNNFQFYRCFEKYSIQCLIDFTIFMHNKEVAISTPVYYYSVCCCWLTIFFNILHFCYPDFLFGWHLGIDKSMRKKESLFHTWHLLNHLSIYVCHSFSRNTSCEILVLLSVLSFLSHDRNQSNFVILVFPWFPRWRIVTLFETFCYFIIESWH